MVINYALPTFLVPGKFWAQGLQLIHSPLASKGKRAAK